ncbi:hypothetical protein MHB81_01645 [Paenibacillus sp. FSL H7-0326]
MSRKKRAGILSAATLVLILLYSQKRRDLQFFALLTLIFVSIQGAMVALLVVFSRRMLSDFRCVMEHYCQNYQEEWELHEYKNNRELRILGNSALTLILFQVLSGAD